MSGILICLVVPDKMGSLGGLEEHGKSEIFTVPNNSKG